MTLLEERIWENRDWKLQFMRLHIKNYTYMCHIYVFIYLAKEKK